MIIQFTFTIISPYKSQSKFKTIYLIVKNSYKFYYSSNYFFSIQCHKLGTYQFIYVKYL